MNSIQHKKKQMHKEIYLHSETMGFQVSNLKRQFISYNGIYMRVIPKVMSNFFFACELGTADEGECGGRWNQLLCYP